MAGGPAERRSAELGRGTPSPLDDGADEPRREPPESQPMLLAPRAGTAQEEALLAPVEEARATSLTLPVPLRCSVQASAARSEESPWAAASPTQRPAQLGESQAMSTVLNAHTRRQREKQARQVPARLHALDDQTSIPREVYSSMMRLGGDARGRLGYGQHRLRFTVDSGCPVLSLRS